QILRILRLAPENVMRRALFIAGVVLLAVGVPTLVFAAMNLGVITLGSITGVFAFGEKINKINIIGIFLAMIAIVCLFYTK
ncbi:MAG: hypothetical protein II131_05140, partial [Neisseriaceae bacterium]|nr:hypothetical protein [Neisseriaceae bacterium]